MKTYIFVVRRITYITGAVQYVFNKANFLENKGWRVLIFSALHGPLYVEKLSKYKDCIFPELYLTPNCFKKSDVCKVVDQIVATVGDCRGDECIVESDALQRAVWAEIIAQRLRCRHLALFVREYHKFFDETALDFLRFKYERHELAGIAKESICQILHDDSVEKRDDTRFSAYCTNVIEDCDDKYSSLLNSKADYSFGYLGRLEKPCVPSIVDGMCAYIARFPDKFFNVVMIGGSIKKDRVAFIHNRFTNYSNVKLVMTGNMYPIPLSFAKRINVFVSTAGSAGATYNMGIPTVKINPLNGVPIGVIGLDFLLGEKGLFNISDYKIEDCIEKALVQREQIVFSKNREDYYKRMYEEFERQLAFVNIAETNSYYGEENLLKIKTANSHRKVFWMIGHVFGAKGVQFCWNNKHSTKDYFDIVSRKKNI